MSESGVSLYNRYRPRNLSELIGQDHVARALANALSPDRGASNYLFSGPRGTGKTTTARILARCLNCQKTDGPTNEPCGECDSCRRTGHEDWLDVLEVDAASRARRIDEMRDWLDSVRYPPAVGRYRITIMDEAHQIGNDAASALLKTLEEPPPHLVVILCTTHPWDLLPTIRSRLQHLVLRRPRIADLTAVLTGVAESEGLTADATVLDMLARAADGSFRDGLGLLEMLAAYGDGDLSADAARELLGAIDRERVAQLSGMMIRGETGAALDLLAEVTDAGGDPGQVLRGLAGDLRHLCLLQQGARPREEWGVNPGELEDLTARAEKADPERVIRGLDALADAQVRIQHGGADPRLQLELVVAKLGAGAPARAAATPRPLAAVPDPPPAAVDPPTPAPVEPPADPPPTPIAQAPAPAPAVPDPTSPPAAPPPDRPPDDEDPFADDPGPEAGSPGAVSPAPTPEPPAEHPPPRPTPEPVGGGAPTGLADTWAGVVAELERTAPPVAGFLEGSVLSQDGGQVIVAVTSQMRRDMLRRPDHRKRVIDLLTPRLPEASDLQFELGAAPPTPTVQPEDSEKLDHDSLRRELKAMFNAVSDDDNA